MVSKTRIKQRPASGRLGPGRRGHDGYSPFALRPSLRIGFGSDVHRLVIGRKLILGGVRIPFEKGPFGHSDGDALSHAVCDALLGAAALGDIGRHFPNSSARWKNAPSLTFLRHASGLLAQSGFAILNVDFQHGARGVRA